VSQWSVPDDATALLMIDAVRRTGAGRANRAVALQAALAAVRNNSDYDDTGESLAHPRNWAPFILVGVDP